MVIIRAGFTLVEVIVAMTLLSIGTLAVAATGFIAAEAFTRAEVQELALREAETILDSLVVLPRSNAGARNVHRTQLVWSASDSIGTITMRVQLPNRIPFEIVAHR